MADGFIKVYRKIQDHPLWQDRPFSKGQAWIDLMLMANHTDTKFLLGNEVVEAKAGQIITSEHKLMARWGWSKSKVRAFLMLIENDEMVARKTDRRKTTLTLCNYRKYNGSRTTKEPQKDPIKNEENNITSEMPIGKSDKRKIFEHNSEAYKCAIYLDRKICERLPKIKSGAEPTLQRWADAFDKLNRLDKYEWDLIADVLVFSQKDPFWKKNILSGDKFRKQFKSLYAKMGGQT